MRTKKRTGTPEEISKQVDLLMDLLDMETPVPEGLSSRILARKDDLDLPKARRINFMTFIQVAAAIVFGIFIGHRFGKLSNIQPGKEKSDAVSEYFKAHHLNIEEAETRKPMLYIFNGND